MISIEVLDRFDLPRLESRWENLVRLSWRPSVFLTHSWMQTWWKYFGEGNDPNLVLIKENDEIQTILPLTFSNGRVFRPLPLPKVLALQTTANYHSNRVDFIGTTPVEEEIEQLWDSIKNLGPWSLLRILPIPSQSPTVKALQDFSTKRGVPLSIANSQRSPFVRIQTDWEEFRKRLSSKTRSFGKRVDTMVQSGELTFETVGGRAIGSRFWGKFFISLN